MSDWPTQPKLPEPTQDELVQAAYRMGYESGVKDGAERADQWVSASNYKAASGPIVAWIMRLLPASADVLAKRMRSA